MVRGARADRLMKLRRRAPEMLRFASDFIERRQPVIDIKGGILEPLGHDRPGALLEFKHEIHVQLAFRRIDIRRKFHEQYITQKFKNGALHARIAAKWRCGQRGR